jgi:peptidoglycan/LPS O-acetylase OafA/YrhL
MLLHLSTSILDDIDTLDRIQVDKHNYIRGVILKRFGFGVDLFFAISGLVIAAPFLRPGKVRLKKYFIRRLIRIEPPYIIAIAVFLLVHLAINSSSTNNIIEHSIASLFYVHNLIYSQWSTILPVAWSLEIEFQFYILAPFLMLLLFKFSRRNQIIIILLLIISSFILQDYKWGNITNYYELFLVGILAAYVNKYVTPRRLIIFDLLMIVSIGLVFFVHSSDLITLIAIAIMMFTFNRVKILKLFFQSSIWSTIGACTYSLYLLHYPLFKLMNTSLNKLITSDNFVQLFLIEIVSVLPLSIVLILIFYYYVERKFMILSQKYK